MRNLVFCLLVVILLTACAATERTTSGATATIAYTEEESQTVDLRLRITDGQQPVQGTIWLYWPDTGGDLAIGPTSDIVLPIPADGAVISVTVTAQGFLAWSEVLTLTNALDLEVRLAKR